MFFLFYPLKYISTFLHLIISILLHILNNELSKDYMMLEQFKKKYTSKQIFLLLGGLIFIIFHLYLVYIISYHLFYELTNPINYDSMLYWVVGKGYSYGESLYAGYYENKPPMIFLLMSLSYNLLGNFHLSGYLCFICLLITGFAPLVFTLIKLHKNPQCSKLGKATSLIIAYTFGMLLMLYTQNTSGASQVENYGSGFIILYILIISSSDSKKLKIYSPSIFLAGLFLMTGILFKEPFILLALGGASFFIHSKKDLIYKLLLPFVYGGILGLLVLILSNSLVPYFTIYIANMLSNHINIFGSPFVRGLHWFSVWGNMFVFSPFFFFSIIALMIVTLLILINQNKNKYQKHNPKVVTTLTIIFFLFTFYLGCFTIGLGGQFYHHHYAFIIPLLVSYLLFTCSYLITLPSYNIVKENVKKEYLNPLSFALVSFISVSSSIGIAALPAFTYEYLVTEETIIKNAEYVDNVLETFLKDTYQYIGFNDSFYLAHTKYLPKGSIFVQDCNNFQNEDSYFVQNFKQQLSEVDIVIINKIECGVLDDYVIQYINDNFTLLVDSDYNITRPESFTDLVYIRNTCLIA